MKRAVSSLGADKANPPAALRRNYTICSMLHDTSAQERDATLSQLIGYKFAVVDATTGAVRKCSQALADAVGLEADDLCGRELAAFVADASAASDLREALRAGTAFSGAAPLRNEHTHVATPGSLHMPLERFSPGSEGAERLVLSVDDDSRVPATDLQRLATALALPSALNATLSSTLDSLQKTFLVTDPTVEDNPIVFASQVRRHVPAMSRGSPGGC